MADALWSLLVALVGVTGTLIGVVLTQRQADRRAAAERDDQEAREERRFRREDEAQTYEHRRVAYAAFLKAFDSHVEGFDRWDMERHGEPLPEDALEDLFDELTQVRIYGTRAGATRADALFDWIYDLMWRDVPKSHRRDLAALMAAYLEQVRSDLSVPD